MQIYDSIFFLNMLYSNCKNTKYLQFTIFLRSGGLYMRLGRICGYDAAAFEAVKNQGLDFIEVCCNYEEDMDKFLAAKESTKALIARTGIGISSVGRWNHDIVENGALVAKRVEKYRQLLLAARELGAKTFVCGINYDKSISLFKNYKLAIEFFSELVRLADGKIKVAIQNCDWNNYIVTPVEWRVVLGEIPELMLKYDASHAYNYGNDYLAEISEWGERIAHVHIKGTTHAGKRGVDDPPAGMDDIKWRSLFSVLYARGYDGDLSIEPHSRTWQGELGNAGVEFTRNFIRQFMLK